MSQEDSILAEFDRYFETIDKSQLDEDLRFVESIGRVGVTFEEYIANLNSVIAFPIIQAGICDDIAFNDFFNKSIEEIYMGDFHNFEVQRVPVVSVEIDSEEYLLDSVYPLAA